MPLQALSKVSERSAVATAYIEILACRFPGTRWIAVQRAAEAEVETEAIGERGRQAAQVAAQGGGEPNAGG